MSFLLDTNVVSEARKPSGSASLKAWLASVPEESIYLSVLVIGEIRRGIELLRRRDPAGAVTIDAWLTRLRRDYADRIVPITLEDAEEWGRMNVPDPIATADGLMAATARVRGWTFVTRDTGRLARTGVGLFDPFQTHP